MRGCPVVLASVGRPERPLLASSRATRHNVSRLARVDAVGAKVAVKDHLHARRPLTVTRILRWADAHHEETGEWPNGHSGPVRHVRGETWDHVDSALRSGLRGLAGGASLARLLADRRGVRNPACLPPLTVENILAWAEDHFTRTGRWPRLRSGPVAAAPGETWKGVHQALCGGGRGLPCGSSLARLLAPRSAER